MTTTALTATRRRERFTWCPKVFNGLNKINCEQIISIDICANLAFKTFFLSAYLGGNARIKHQYK
jgi:hypothetical protein